MCTSEGNHSDRCEDYGNGLATSPTLSVADDDVRDRLSPSDPAEDLLAGLDDFTPLLPIWMSSAFYESHLKHLLDYAGAGNAFSLSSVPATAAWGEGDLHNFLCYGTRPLNILAIGELEMFGAAVDHASMVSSTRMRVDLLRDVDHSSSSALLHRSRGVPVIAPPMFEASRVNRQSNKMFTNIVDATDRWPPAQPIVTVPLSDLAVGDIVLLETALIRDDRATAVSYPTWQQFACKFVLCNVALLARAPRTPQ
ncbi:uncharacterized protein TRAVEDRAFT_42933 [Trametes versicolor FP-101664 SS1]|uniref:uncharacterized protein n=1 Tax=Trametes versicolor (strain FP-101664) TaxID=717944 RepID=UPI0004623360|nr:uncharacterized protein TRAVEDRAFT_42933 [Trametes versicolor FP-101664 SS1]EIW62575.1 hypothetical protein TRAVEDRAFT_42933 [Trametes versicolor FP-101664 SS1]